LFIVESGIYECGQDILMDVLGLSLVSSTHHSQLGMLIFLPLQIGAATVYLTVVSCLTRAGIAVPLLAAILLDSLVLIPFYLTMTMYIAFTTDVWLNEIGSVHCHGSSSVIAALNIVILTLQSLTL
jgi:hypothetical protein